MMDGKLLNKLFHGNTNIVVIQFVRYICSGGLALLVDKTLFVITHYYTFHLNNLWSTSIGFIVGTIITYFLSFFWVFNEHRTQNRFVEVIFFVAIGVVGLGLITLFMWLFSEVIDVPNDFISNLMATVLVTLWNFIAKKYILFTKSKHNERKNERFSSFVRGVDS